MKKRTAVTLAKELLSKPCNKILDVVEWVYRGQYEVALSELPYRIQDQFMAKLHEELGKHLVRASIQSVMATAQSLSRGRRCLWACSSSQASPTTEAIEAEHSSTRVSCQSTNKQVRHLLGFHKTPQGCHLQVLPSPSPLHPDCMDE